MQKKELIDINKQSKQLLFYKAMHYPTPKNYQLFSTQKTENPKNIQSTTFSRYHESELQKEYTSHIQKSLPLLKSLPFVKEMYLCNSITFNALKESSDIDLFIITTKNALRRARFFSVLILRITKKIRKKTRKKKFCLSFYCTEDKKNLYPICLDRGDIYLHYRIAHLVPLYTNPQQKKNIREENKRITELLPNLPLKQNIQLSVNTVINKKIFEYTKKIIEFLLTNKLGSIIERTIKQIRSPLVIRKKSKLWSRGEWIIINENILKFYEDKREKYRLKYQIETKNKLND